MEHIDEQIDEHADDGAACVSLWPTAAPILLFVAVSRLRPRRFPGDLLEWLRRREARGRRVPQQQWFPHPADFPVRRIGPWRVLW
jgi:hypothetical protein